jgi:starch synthase
VPIVRRTGGLADTVQEWDPVSGAGNGFVFSSFLADALLGAAHRALRVYADAAAMQRLQHAGMSDDFSWAASARRYRAAYDAALERHRARARGGPARA